MATWIRLLVFAAIVVLIAVTIAPPVRSSSGDAALVAPRGGDARSQSAATPTGPEAGGLVVTPQ